MASRSQMPADDEDTFIFNRSSVTRYRHGSGSASHNPRDPRQMHINTSANMPNERIAFHNGNTSASVIQPSHAVPKGNYILSSGTSKAYDRFPRGKSFSTFSLGAVNGNMNSNDREQTGDYDHREEKSKSTLERGHSTSSKKRGLSYWAECKYAKMKTNKNCLKRTPEGFAVFMRGNMQVLLKGCWQKEIVARKIPAEMKTNLQSIPSPSVEPVEKQKDDTDTVDDPNLLNVIESFLMKQKLLNNERNRGNLHSQELVEDKQESPSYSSKLNSNVDPSSSLSKTLGAQYQYPLNNENIPSYSDKSVLNRHRNLSSEELQEHHTPVDQVKDCDDRSNFDLYPSTPAIPKIQEHAQQLVNKAYSSQISKSQAQIVSPLTNIQDHPHTSAQLVEPCKAIQRADSIPGRSDDNQGSSSSEEDNLCRFYMRGYCRKGSDCKFKHSDNVSDDETSEELQSSSIGALIAALKSKSNNTNQVPLSNTAKSDNIQKIKASRPKPVGAPGKKPIDALTSSPVCLDMGKSMVQTPANVTVNRKETDNREIKKNNLIASSNSSTFTNRDINQGSTITGGNLKHIKNLRNGQTCMNISKDNNLCKDNALGKNNRSKENIEIGKVTPENINAKRSLSQEKTKEKSEEKQRNKIGVVERSVNENTESVNKISSDNNKDRRGKHEKSKTDPSDSGQSHNKSENSKQRPNRERDDRNGQDTSIQAASRSHQAPENKTKTTSGYNKLAKSKSNTTNDKQSSEKALCNKNKENSDKTVECNIDGKSNKRKGSTTNDKQSSEKAHGNKDKEKSNTLVESDSGNSKTNSTVKKRDELKDSTNREKNKNIGKDNLHARSKEKTNKAVDKNNHIHDSKDKKRTDRSVDKNEKVHNSKNKEKISKPLDKNDKVQENRNKEKTARSGKTKDHDSNKEKTIRLDKNNKTNTNKNREKTDKSLDNVNVLKESSKSKSSKNQIGENTLRSSEKAKEGKSAEKTQRKDNTNEKKRKADSNTNKESKEHAKNQTEPDLAVSKPNKKMRTEETMETTSKEALNRLHKRNEEAEKILNSLMDVNTDNTDFSNVVIKTEKEDDYEQMYCSEGSSKRKTDCNINLQSEPNKRLKTQHLQQDTITRRESSLDEQNERNQHTKSNEKDANKRSEVSCVIKSETEYMEPTETYEVMIKTEPIERSKNDEKKKSELEKVLRLWLDDIAESEDLFFNFYKAIDQLDAPKWKSEDFPELYNHEINMRMFYLLVHFQERQTNWDYILTSMQEYPNMGDFIEKEKKSRENVPS